VNDKKFVVESFQNYLVNTVKAAHPTAGLPIPLSFRSRSQSDRT
jgi:predicted GTPase